MSSLEKDSAISTWIEKPDQVPWMVLLPQGNQAYSLPKLCEIVIGYMEKDLAGQIL